MCPCTGSRVRVKPHSLNRASHLGSHCWYNCPGTLCLSQVCAAHLKIMHPYILSMGAVSSSQGHRLGGMTGYQDSAYNNGHRVTCPVVKLYSISFIIFIQYTFLVSDLPQPAAPCGTAVQPIRWSCLVGLRPARWLQWLLVEYWKIHQTWLFNMTIQSTHLGLVMQFGNRGRGELWLK